MFRFAAGLLGISALLSCAQVPTESGNEVVKKSIDSHGGWENYQALDTLIIDKTTRLFLEDGSLESEISEKQIFIRKPEYKTILIRESDTLIGRITDTIYHPRILAAEFVLFQPFKLNEGQPVLENTGAFDFLLGEGPAEVKVEFEEGKDTWWFYFDDSYRCIANKVLHNNRYSLIQNLEFQEHKGLLLHKHRKSYFTDSNGNKKYLRAQYFYDILK